MTSTIKVLIIFTFILALFAFIGCEKKTDTPEVKEETTQEEPAKIEETPEEVTEPEVPVVQIPDLTGQWTGKFDARNTVLNITEQTDSTFKGKITISYRDVINQEVEGTISPSTMSMTMKDLLHSRFRGRYSGTLSEDGKNYSGTFTMDLDKSQFSFNLNKK
jgi:predicted membrane protein